MSQIEPLCRVRARRDGARPARRSRAIQPSGRRRWSASGAIIGPYARLRPGAEIGEDAHIGNFVEVKNTQIDKGAKANHLTYLGDARVGAGANIGAGTITCNYDGFDKYHTDIGAGAFIGSDTALVAPVKVGDGRDHGGGLGDHQGCRGRRAGGGARRSRVEKPGWAKAFREKGKSRKRNLMCGIVGIAGTRDVAPVILEALKRLEYRGYDSAGIATLVGGQIERRRSPGKLVKLDAVLREQPLHRPYRHRPYPLGDPWRAHRDPTPIRMPSARVAIVHNGIIENFRELRDELIGRGPQIRIPDRQRSRRPSGHRLSRQGHDARRRRPRRRCARLTGAYSHRHDLQGSRRSSDRRAQGRAAGGGLWRRRKPISAPTPSRWRLSPTASPIWKTAMSR